MQSQQHIPPEVWRRIIYLATYTPLECKWKYSPDVALWRGWAYEPYLGVAESAQSKEALMKVSKLFRELSMEFYWEYVIMPRTPIRPLERRSARKEIAERLQQVITILERFPTESSLPGCGWWIKRMDISSSSLKSSRVDLLIRLLSSCPNIHTLVFLPSNIADHESTDGVKKLFLTLNMANSLRRLDLRASSISSPIVTFADHVPFLPPSLQSLQLTASLGSSFLPLSQFVHLTALALLLHPFETTFDTPHLPLLQHLSIQNVNRQSFPSFLALLKAHGDTITSLHFKGSGAINPYDAFPRIAKRLPHLQSLVIYDWTTPRGGIGAFLPFFTTRNFTHLGVEFLPRSAFQLIADGLENLRSEMSGVQTYLKCLQLFRVKIYDDADVEQLASALLEFGVCLLDSDGQVVGRCSRGVQEDMP